MEDVLKEATTLYFHLNENAVQPNAGLSGIEEYDNEKFVVLRNSSGVLAVFADLSNEKAVVEKLDLVQEEDWPEALRGGGKNESH